MIQQSIIIKLWKYYCCALQRREEFGCEWERVECPEEKSFLWDGNSISVTADEHFIISQSTMLVLIFINGMTQHLFVLKKEQRKTFRA
jgi:hypothetical protein